MDEKSKWQCTVPVWLITRLTICPQIWNVPAWSTMVIYTPYLSCLETLRGKWTARSLRCHCSASLCFSIMWLLMNLSGESYAITQQAWQCAPDSFVKIPLIVQRLYYNVQEKQIKTSTPKSCSLDKKNHLPSLWSLSSPRRCPKITFCLTLFHTFCFLLNFIYAPFELRQVFMIYSWGDCVQRRDVKGWAEWVPVRRSVVPAKVNKEELYHTICCLWSVTHGIWTAARSLPTSLFACLTDSGQVLKNLSCRFSK